MNVYRRIATRLLRRQSGRRAPDRVRLAVLNLEDRLAPAAVNPIVAENQLTGTPQSVWDVSGAGDPSIQGFATDISVNQGQTVNFKINDTATAPYHIDIYRMGYYQGNGARLVASIPSSQTIAKVQPSALVDQTTKLVDAGNWSVTASWAVPANATSGIYFARVTRNDTGGASHIMFVVRSDSSHSDLLFQTSDSTWQAYNTWGGYSLYQYTNGVPGPGPSGQGAVAVSYNRPITLRANPGGFGSYNSPFHAEYPMVRWLESNGYNVSYFTDVDSDRNGALIQNHQVFLSVGHDEYWSGGQRANVEAARDAGVNLAFFSGNEVFWKTRWLNSIDGSGTPYRTLVTYKESVANDRIDPLDLSQGVWTGTWRDNRFSPPADGGRPENALTGTMYMNDRTNVDLGISMQVPAALGQMRFWRNTAVANLAAGQVATIGDRVVGYETDEDVDNGFRPAGLIDMSATTFTTTSHVVASWGTVVGPGTSTHEITLYRAPSGALVFGAGTVQWSWGLDGIHDDGNSVPDLNMQQATVNLFADMGVQPGLLQPGLMRATASIDVVPPGSVITAPANDAHYLTGSTVTITGTATESGGGVVAGVEVSVDDGKTWHPATITGKSNGTYQWTYAWTPDAPGQPTIKSRAVDDSGNLETPAAGVSVTVSFQATSRTGLVAEYSFNQGSGTTLTDFSGNNNNGTITSASWAPGKFGQALSFNGTNSWVTINNSASLNLTNGMTLEAWVNPHTLDDWAAVLLKERSGGLAYAMYADHGVGGPASGYVHVGNNDVSVTGNSTLPLNAWSHLAVTFDGSNLNFYVNGTLTSSGFASGSIVTSSNPLRIGGDSIWGEFFDGLIDQVRVYNRALNQAEIRSNMSTPVGSSQDTTPATASVTSPTAGATVSGITTLSTSASDNVYVASVQYLLDGQPLGAPVTATPYSLAWDTRKVTNGTHVLSARAVDLAGNTTTSAEVSVNVSNAPDTTPPAVRITYPLDGFGASGPVVLSSVASDNLGVASVQYQLNGVNIGPALTSAPYRTLWDPATAASGTYSLVAVATDAAGNVTTSSPVSVTVDHTAPTVTSFTPAADSIGVSTASSVTVTFSEPVQSGSIAITLRDPTGNTVASTIAYNDATHTATLSHGTVALDPLTVYTVTVSAADLAGNVMAPYSWSFSTSNAIVGATLWDASTVPATVSVNDPRSIELGLKFQSDVAGTITGIRFYKGAGNTGTHVGHLWTVSGTLLATVTFTNETASGWQQANFTTPVAIAANTTYVVSYFAPAGNYSADSGYFASELNSGPLHALADAAAGGNGVYLYTTGGAFPTNSFNATNYRVDVVFNSSTQNTTPPTVTDETPVPSATSVSQTTVVTATFSKSVQAGTISFVLKDAGGNTVPATVSYNGGTSTATLSPTGPLAATTVYTATVSGATDLSGNVMTAPFSWSFTTENPSAPPAVIAAEPAPGETGVSKGAVIEARFSKPIQAASIAFVLKDAAGNVVPSTIGYEGEENTAVLTPNSALAPLAVYTATVSGATDLSGNVMTAPYSWSFTTAGNVTNAMLFGAAATPAVPAVNDPNAVEVGLKFTADTSGYVTGLRFYKGTGNTGTHVGHLWSSAGTLLGTVTFAGETASGWQQANFTTPVAVSANTTYVVSYYAPNGHYAYTSGYFASGTDSGVLHAPSSVAANGNGVYLYAAGGGFPTGTYNAANYWVDLVFSTSNADTTPPTVTTQSPAAGATGVLPAAAIEATFSESVQAATVTTGTFTLADAAGNIVAATVAYDNTTHTATLTPSALLAFSATYTATVSGVKDLAGNAVAAPLTWSFTTVAPVVNGSIFGTATPAVPADSDSNALEVGAKFTSDVSGYVTAIRFYKGAGNTGTHVGHLWTASGTLLATVTFTGETATGWQQAALSTPVAISANTTYVVSYFAPNGHEAYTSGYFASSGKDSGVLHAPSTAVANGNGVYLYASGGGFPGGTYNGNNYWVDVLFSSASATPPAVTGQTPAPAATGVALGTVVSATFSEPVQGSTVNVTFTGPSGANVPASFKYDPIALTATVTPNAPLAPLTTYTVTVSGAKDLSGNTMSAPVTWTFTTKAVWQQSGVADFGAGVLNGSAITNSSGGEVQLAPSFADDFNGTSLSSAWTATSWASAGGGPLSATVSATVLALTGGEVLSTAPANGSPVEGRINFAAAPYQHFGLATDFASLGGNSWAIFSTAGTSNTLFARVNALGATQDVSLGALPSGYHVYQVKPAAGAYKFYVDGVLLTTITATIPNASAMKIALSNFNGAPQPALQVDWVRLNSYASSGTFVSSVFNAGQTVSWGTVSWTAFVPSGTTMVIETSSSTDGTNWSSWAQASNGSQVASPAGQYLRYRITFTTNDFTLTASLSDIAFDWS